MTCIVGYCNEEGVWIGGDSQGTAGDSKMVNAHPKVFALETHGEKFVIGYTWSFRMGQLLRYRLDVPANENNVDALEYMVDTIIDCIRKLFDDNGFSRNESGEEKGGPFLIGYKGRLFEVQTDYSVLESIGNYVAIGSGAKVAEGAMYASEGQDKAGRIGMAIEAAARHTVSVGGDITVIKLENTGA